MCEAQSTSLTLEMCEPYQDYEYTPQMCQETYINFMYYFAANGMTCDSTLGESPITIAQAFAMQSCCESTDSTEPAKTTDPGTF